MPEDDNALYLVVPYDEKLKKGVKFRLDSDGNEYVFNIVEVEVVEDGEGMRAKLEPANEETTKFAEAAAARTEQLH